MLLGAGVELLGVSLSQLGISVPHAIGPAMGMIMAT